MVWPVKSRKKTLSPWGAAFRMCCPCLFREAGVWPCFVAGPAYRCQNNGVACARFCVCVRMWACGECAWRERATQNSQELLIKCDFPKQSVFSVCVAVTCMLWNSIDEVAANIYKFYALGCTAWYGVVSQNPSTDHLSTAPNAHPMSMIARIDTTSPSTAD